MDATSNAGQVALHWARKALRSYQSELSAKYSGALTIAETAWEDDDYPAARMDAILTTISDAGEDAGVPVVRAVMEAKARFFSEAKLNGVYGGKLLLEIPKMDAGRQMALDLAAEFWALFVLVNSNCYLVMRMTDRHGNWIPEITTEEKMTSLSINNPNKHKTLCALISTETAHRYDLPK